MALVAEKLAFLVVAWIEVVRAAVHDTDLGARVKRLQCDEASFWMP